MYLYCELRTSLWWQAIRSISMITGWPPINSASMAVPAGTRVSLLSRESPFALDERGNVSVRSRIDRDTKCARVGSSASASPSGSASRPSPGLTSGAASSALAGGSASACRETLTALLHSPRPGVDAQLLNIQIT